MKRISRNRGFTLVELLVAITILSVLMSVAFGAVRIGGKSLGAGIERADRSEEARATADFLRRQFAQLTPETIDVDDKQWLVFEGDANRVDFVTLSPAATLGPGLMTATLIVEPADDGVELWFGVRPYNPGNPDTERTEALSKSMLYGDLAGARIRYFGVPDEYGEPGWHDYWQRDAYRYPLAVEISLTENAMPDVESRLVLRVRAGNQS